jgi:hypothetical protein
VYVMTLPPPIFDGFFRNPFGGEMNPVGGMGGEGGVLENIQQQVSENGQALQALQGGIGGLPNTPFQPATLQPIAPVQQPAINQPIAYENPGELLNLLDFNPPSITDAATDMDAQIRADYDKAVADAKRQRAEGFMGRVMLPGEMPFEDFKKNRIAFTNSGPLQTQSDIFNIAQVEQNPGMDYSNLTMTTGNLYAGELNGPAQTLDNYVPTDLFGVGGEQGFFNQSSLSEPPRLPTGALRGGGMDQLFGRAFAGKPV